MTTTPPDLSPDPRAKRASLGLKIIIGIVLAVVAAGVVWSLGSGEKPGGTWAWAPSPPHPNAGAAPTAPGADELGPPIQQLEPARR